MTGPLLDVRDVTVEYPIGSALLGGRRRRKAVDRVSFTLERGAALGVVGESGCGKSTLARAILRLVPLASGVVRLNGDDLASLTGRRLRERRRRMQLVFQDPIGALDPRMTAAQIIAEPLGGKRRGAPSRMERARSMMEAVGLSREHADRYPHEFSGGQCQRIGIARALVGEPALLICDEPVSALDVSIQAQILSLLETLRATLGLTMIFIAHDLRLVRHLCDSVIVMYRGRLVEQAGRAELFSRPRHPYTQALLDAIPVPDPRAERQRAGARPAAEPAAPAADVESGCAFRARCPHARERCQHESPALRRVGGARVACHFAEQIAR
ncbi:ATP-binding cassette domain-containing protein [soil metagenome]